MGGIKVRRSGGGQNDVDDIANGWKTFALQPLGERFAHANFECLAEQDEARVGILGAGTRLGFQVQFEAGIQQIGRGGDGAKELYIPG